MMQLKIMGTKTQRAKNRVKEHGQIFELIKEEIFKGEEAVLVRCICAEHKNDPWLGWFTVTEVRWELK